MKIVKVVAAVICDSLDESRYLLQLEVMVNLRASGNFQAER